MVPPDPIPNSEVKRRCADGSVGLPHVRVGHRQVVNVEPRAEWLGVFILINKKCGQNRIYFDRTWLIKIRSLLLSLLLS